MLFARNEYVLVHDEQNTRFPGVFNFVTPAASAESRSQGVFCKGKLGVDLWIVPLVQPLPAAEFQPIAIGNERVTEPNKWHQIAVRIPFDRSLTCLLHPVRQGAAPANVTRLGKPPVTIAGPGFRDVLFSGDAQVRVEGVGAIDFHGALGRCALGAAHGTSASSTGNRFASTAAT